MTTMTDENTRIVIALTERTPLRELWQKALQHRRETRTELLALFVADDQWHRAASLPFTCEISRVSGVNVNFTRERAKQVHEDAISRARRQMEELACEANLPFAFEVLLESDQKRIREFVSGSQNILIAPTFLTKRPLFAALEELGCQIVLIEAVENTGQGH
jgi:hypothetical protein